MVEWASGLATGNELGPGKGWMRRSMDKSIQRAIELIGNAKHVVALTGAGISTPSGIPDYRSPKSGLWKKAEDMVEVASTYGFRHQPDKFYEWLRPLLDVIRQATPNPAHVALAQLEAAGHLQAIITQNIDLLHGRAGSRTVYEVHGHLREIVCPACHYLTAAADALDAFMARGVAPRCPRCRHVMKPNVVLFGDLLPRATLRAAQAAVQAADLMIVAGSSLEVSPAGDLPEVAQAHGARLIVVNFGPTHMDAAADVVIHADVAEVLPRLAAPWTAAPAAGPLSALMDMAAAPLNALIAALEPAEASASAAVR